MLYLCHNTLKIFMGEVIKKRLKQQKFESAEQEAILNLIISSFWLRSKIDSICQEFEITVSQYNVLRILRGIYPDGYPRCEIISRMLEPSPDVTRLIDKLISARFVERFSSNDDRRHSISRITKKGLTLLDTMKPKMDEFEKLIRKLMSQEEFKKLSELCEKIYGVDL